MSFRIAFEEWCKNHCSPGADSSDWYWRIFKAGAEAALSGASQPMNDDIATQLGFADASEFHRMVAAVDLSSQPKVAAFKRWQDEDGTKDGLAALGDGSEAVTPVDGEPYFCTVCGDPWSKQPKCELAGPSDDVTRWEICTLESRYQSQCRKVIARIRSA